MQGGGYIRYINNSLRQEKTIPDGSNWTFKEAEALGETMGLPVFKAQCGVDPQKLARSVPSREFLIWVQDPCYIT